MQRRSFLKTLAAAALAPLVPMLPKRDELKVDVVGCANDSTIRFNERLRENCEAGRARYEPEWPDRELIRKLGRRAGEHWNRIALKAINYHRPL